MKGCYACHNMVDKLQLNNLGAKFPCYFSISRLKLQCCHDNFSYSAKMVSKFENVTDNKCNLSSMILVANEMI